MKKIVFIGVIIGQLFIISSILVAQETELAPPTSTNPNLCSDSEFGVEFYCEPTWKWRRLEDALLIIISNEPMVTMTITKINTPIKFLGQINDTYIRERGLYAEHFQLDRVNFLDGQAVHVKANSLKYPDIRLSDYFYVQHGALYGLLFSVKPKEEWDQYKFNIQKIVQSFKKLEL